MDVITNLVTGVKGFCLYGGYFPGGVFGYLLSGLSAASELRRSQIVQQPVNTTLDICVKLIT